MVVNRFWFGVAAAVGVAAGVKVLRRLSENSALRHVPMGSFEPNSNFSALPRVTRIEVGKEHRQPRARLGVPDVIGETERAAQRILQSKGLNVVTRENEKGVLMGHVSYDPKRVEIIVRHGVVVDCYRPTVDGTEEDPGISWCRR